MEINNLNTIIYLITNLFNIYVKLRFLSLFFDRATVPKKLEIPLFLLYYLINSSLYLLFANPVVNLIVNLVLFFALTHLYKGKLSTRLISTILTYAAKMLLEMIVYYVTINIALSTDLINAPNIIAVLLDFALVLVLEKFFKHQLTPQLNAAHWLAICVVPLGSTVIIVLSSGYTPISIVIIAGFLFAMNMIVFYLYDVLIKYYKEKNEKALIKQQNIALEQQVELYNESQRNIRMIKHDMKNHFLSIREMAQSNKTGAIIDYLNNMFDYMESKTEYIDSGNAEIDSILNYKIGEAKKDLVDVNLRVNIPDKIMIDAFDLNVILSNLIDNALDAISNCNEKMLIIDIELEQLILYITIKNSYCGSILMKNGRLYTTKKDVNNHGLGLMSVEHTLEKYDGTLSTEHTNTDFTAKVLLYNRVKQ